MRAGADARQHWHVLTTIEKSDLAQEVYVRHVCVALQELFNQAAAAGAEAIVSWLPSWHEQLLAFVSAERDWFALQLPEQQPGLFLQVRLAFYRTLVQQ